MHTPTYPLTLLYDGACPVCKLEMDNLMARNTQGQLRFVDISLPGFDPTPYGATLAAMNALIHAQRADGTLVIGVEVFRLAYDAVGLGRWAAPTGWPVLRPVVDAAYALFARHRNLISRLLAPLITRMAARRALRRSRVCQDGICTTQTTPPQTTPAAQTTHRSERPSP